VGPIAGLLEAARGAVDSSRRDARLEAHLQPVWNVFGDFLEILPKGYGATVLIAACLLTSRMNVGPHGESQGKRSNVGRNGAHSSSAESPYGGMSLFIGRPNLDRSGARALLNVQNLRRRVQERNRNSGLSLGLIEGTNHEAARTAGRIKWT